MKNLFAILLIALSVSVLAQTTDATLTTQSQQIKNETTPGANTANRVGTLFQNLTYSKKSFFIDGTAGGTDTYTVTLNNGAITALSSQWFVVKFTNSNTGAATLNINSIGAKSLIKTDGSSLSSGDINAGSVHLLSYDGTNLQVLSLGGGNIYNVNGTVTSNRIIDGDNKTIDFIDFDQINFEGRLIDFDAVDQFTMAATGAGITIPGDSVTIVANGDVRIHTDDTLEIISSFWKLNGVGGTNGQVPTVQADGSVIFDTPSGGGGSTAAGAMGNAQFKSAGGGLQAEAAYTYDSAANILTVPLVKITSGSPGANKVLTSDADGDGSWVAGTIGAQDLFITGPAMWPTVTNGCSNTSTSEIGDKTYKSLDFDQTTDENAQFQFSLPRNWNNGTITVTVYWTATGSGSGTVQFEVSAVALSNDDPFSTAFGTAVVIDDTMIALDDVHITPTSSAITIGGTPADGDLVFINIMRDVSDDTLSTDAKLLGIRVTITLDAATSE